MAAKTPMAMPQVAAKEIKRVNAPLRRERTKRSANLSTKELVTACSSLAPHSCAGLVSSVSSIRCCVCSSRMRGHLGRCRLGGYLGSGRSRL